MHSSYQSAVQLCSTISRTFLLYSRLFSLNIRAASELAGELGLGSQSKDCTKNLVLLLREKHQRRKKENHEKKRENELQRELFQPFLNPDLTSTSLDDPDPREELEAWG
ncbi:hypothetical protein BHE74_00018907 [Ensete ventricosum]|nr:hypothetical protein GW17_00018822 [Ensete ventricosum]RWW73231.1 hypothetical protein BHE74_00018907 [Ensete ventricosum]RZS10798.1 hypothetical protein BHM03_00042070 [Ensete ventricosum]